MPFLFHLDNDLMISDFDMATVVNELLVEGLGAAQSRWREPLEADSQ